MPLRGSPVPQSYITVSAARETSRVALVTCGPLNGLHADDELLVTPLKAHGVDAVPAVWDDPAVDWSTYDLVVVRSTWPRWLRYARSRPG